MPPPELLTDDEYIAASDRVAEYRSFRRTDPFRYAGAKARFLKACGYQSLTVGKDRGKNREQRIPLDSLVDTEPWRVHNAFLSTFGALERKVDTYEKAWMAEVLAELPPSTPGTSTDAYKTPELYHTYGEASIFLWGDRFPTTQRGMRHFLDEPRKKPCPLRN